MSQPDPTDHRGRLRKAWLSVSAAIAIVLFFALVIIKPTMPKRILLLTGPADSAYHELGKRYAEDLRGRGLEAEVIITTGVLENVRRLATPNHNVVAFAPSIVDWNDAVGADSTQLVALGSIRLEPLWLFYRSDLDIVRLTDLAGKTVVTEGEGTVSDYAGHALINENGLSNQVPFQRLPVSNAQSLVEGFAAGVIDAGFIAGEAGSPIVKSMLNAADVKFLSFERAEAYAGLIPGLTELVAPEGVFDLGRNVPKQDARLLAATTCLVTNKGLHPAVVPMLLVAAENSREKLTTYQTKVTFPSKENITLPLDTAARRYFNQGETGLSKFLPYWLTRLLNHLGFFVLPIVAAVLVLLKMVLTGLRMWGGFLLKRLFKQLLAVEKGHAAGDETSKLLDDLDRIDQASAAMFVPLSTVHDYIDFRQFLHDMRERVATKDDSVQ